MKIPNILTVIRIACIPVLVVIFYLPLQSAPLLSAGLFALASATDWLDGYLARILKQTTALGAFLDPVADKLLVAVSLVLLVGRPNLPHLALPALIIVSREIVISALREWMAELGKRASVAVSLVGKVKTVMQMISIIVLLMFSHDSVGYGLILGYILLYVAAVLTLWSMIMYLKAAWPEFNWSE